MVVMLFPVGVIVPRNNIHWIKAPNSKQDFQGDIAARCLDDPYSVQIVANPLLYHFDMLWTDKIDLVEHNQIGKGDLTNL